MSVQLDLYREPVAPPSELVRAAREARELLAERGLSEPLRAALAPFEGVR